MKQPKTTGIPIWTREVSSGTLSVERALLPEPGYRDKRSYLVVSIDHDGHRTGLRLVREDGSWIEYRTATAEEISAMSDLLDTLAVDQVTNC